MPAEIIPAEKSPEEALRNSSDGGQVKGTNKRHLDIPRLATTERHFHIYDRLDKKVSKWSQEISELGGWTTWLRLES